MVLKFLCIVFVALLAAYYISLSLSLVGIFRRFSRRTVTLRRLLIPFYFWVYMED